MLIICLKTSQMKLYDLVFCILKKGETTLCLGYIYVVYARLLKMGITVSSFSLPREQNGDKTSET